MITPVTSRDGRSSIGVGPTARRCCRGCASGSCGVAQELPTPFSCHVRIESDVVAGARHRRNHRGM